MDINVSIPVGEVVSALADDAGLILDLLSDYADPEAFDRAGLIKDIADVHSGSAAHRRIAPFLRALADALEEQELE